MFFVYQLTVQILELIVFFTNVNLLFTVDSTRLYLITFEKGRSNFINAVQVPVCKLTVIFPYQFYIYKCIVYFQIVNIFLNLD